MSNFDLSAVLGLQTEDTAKFGIWRQKCLCIPVVYCFCQMTILHLATELTHTHTHWKAEDVKRTKKAEKWKDQSLIPRKYHLWAAWLSLEIKTYFP